MGIFKKPFPPGRPAGPSDYQDLIEIRISPNDEVLKSRPTSLLSTTSLPSLNLHSPTLSLSPNLSTSPKSTTNPSTNITIFYIPKTLLNRYSDRFQLTWKCPSTANQILFCFQDMDVDLFSILTNWLMYATIVDAKGEKLDIESLGRLYELAQRLEIRPLRNNIVKEIFKMLEGEDAGGLAKRYLEILKCTAKELRELALEHLLRREDFTGIIDLMEEGMNEVEKEELGNKVEGMRVNIGEREEEDAKDLELGVKTKQTWHRKPWYKTYFVL